MQGNRALLWLAIGLAVILLIVLATLAVPGAAPAGGENTQRLVYLLLAALLVSGSVWTALRNDTAKALKYVAVWVVIAGIIALLYLVTR